MRATCYLLLIFLIIHFPSIAQKKYYFSNKPLAERKPIADGTRQAPFVSLGELSKLQLKAGDTVFFEGGNIFEGIIRIDNIHGMPGKPVVICSYGKGKVKLIAGDGPAAVISGSSHLTINGVVAIGAGRKDGNVTDGIKFGNCDNIKLNHIEVSKFQKSGLLLFNCKDAEINDVVATDNGQAGITVEGDYQKRISERIHFINCRADNNPGDPTNLTNHSGNGIIVGNCRNVLIEYCTATNNGWDMPRIGNGPVGIWAYEADSVIIQHCISYRNKTAKGAADGGGFDLDGGVTNSIIQYCLSYENQGSGYGIYQYWSASNWKNNTVRYCVSINDGKITEGASAMYIWNGHNGDSTFTDFYAYNNFFYNDAKYAFSFSSDGQHRRFHFFNNVFIASDSSNIYDGVDSSGSDVFVANVWTRVNGGFSQDGNNNLEQWASSKGYENNQDIFFGVRLDKKYFDLPSTLYISDPRSLQTNSVLKHLCNPVLRNRGFDVKRMFGIDPGKRDFFGNTIPRGAALEPGVCELN